ncbi:MAG: hypothetical protein EOM20_14120 [Spartobacteria bacterium]|nr:hypothetical protein [Spartobacteria bacterium]
MWSIFEGGKRFFSRTIEEKGPLGVICGSADGRFFALPFSNSSGAVPLALEVNVVLPPRSSLLIGPMTMAQADTLPTLLEPVDAWWSGQVAGLAGGLLGGLLGCLGALLGWLSGRGKARTFCRMASRWMIPVGVALFAAGIFAVVRKQPYAVYYPLLLLGVLYTVLGFTTAQVIRRRFKNIEARTLEAKDIL